MSASASVPIKQRIGTDAPRVTDRRERGAESNSTQETYTCTPYYKHAHETQRQNQPVTLLEWYPQAEFVAHLHVSMRSICQHLRRAGRDTTRGAKKNKTKQPVLESASMVIKTIMSSVCEIKCWVSYRGSCHPPVSLSSCVDAHLYW